MPIILNNAFYAAVDELFKDRTGKPYDRAGKREYTRMFRVIVKQKEMSAWSVCAAPGIPIPGAPYIAPSGIEYDLLAVAVEIFAKPEYDDDWQNWIATVNYSTDLDKRRNPDESNARNHPEKEAGEITWESDEVEIAPSTDLDGKAYMNSADMPLTPAPTMPVPIPVLSVTRNELTFTAEQSLYWSNAINADTFLNSPPGRCQCKSPSAKLKDRGSFAYWQVNYKIRFAPYIPDPMIPGGTVLRSWQPQYLDQGTMEWDEEKKVHETIFTKAHHKVTHPVLLDGHGRRQTQRLFLGLDPVTGEEMFSGLIPVWLSFRQFRTVPFSYLFTNGMGG